MDRYKDLTKEDIEKALKDIMFQKEDLKKRKIVIYTWGTGFLKMFDEAMKAEVNRLYPDLPTCGQQYEKQNNEDEEMSQL